MSTSRRAGGTVGSRPDPSTTDDHRLRVVLNRSAGTKLSLASSDPAVGDLEAILAGVGIDAEVLETDSVDDARTIARQAVLDRAPVLAVAVGDGTIGPVASELVGSETALGILPLGSVMNIPRMLGLPRDIPEAATILAKGGIRAIDVGVVRGEPFFETASVGLNAAVFSAASQLETGDRRSILRAVWVALRYRPSRMRIELDEGVLRTRALTVTVSNGPYTGTGMTVAPEARLDDGRLDIRVFERFSKLELLRHFASITFGRRRYAPEISMFRSSFARISSVHPLPTRVDSRDVGSTPVEFTVRPGALRVVVPPDGLPTEAGPRDAATS